MSKISKQTLQLTSMAISLASPLLAYADISLTQTSDLTRMLCAIAATMFWILMGTAIVMVIVAAFYYVTGGSDPNKISQAHKILLYSAVGIVVALMAKNFPPVVASVLGGTSGVPGC